MDHREQIVLQSAQNALPHSVSIEDYRFRQVADRLTQRGLLEIIKSTARNGRYAITLAGEDTLKSIPINSIPRKFHSASFEEANVNLAIPAIAAE